MSDQDNMPTEEEIRKLREQLHALAEKAIDRMFRIQPDGTNPFYTTFDEREHMAEVIGDGIEAFLLATHADWDPGLDRINGSLLWPCPRCDRQCGRATDDDGNPLSEQMELEGKPGKVPINAALFYCEHCRKRFSPLQDAFGARNREL